MLMPEIKLGCENPVPAHLKEKSIRILQLHKSAERVRSKRCIKPRSVVGQPILIVNNDGSEDAMCAMPMCDGG